LLTAHVVVPGFLDRDRVRNGQGVVTNTFVANEFNLLYVLNERVR